MAGVNERQLLLSKPTTTSRSSTYDEAPPSSSHTPQCCVTFRKYVTVEPILFLYFLAFVIYWPTLGLYVYKVVGEQLNFNSDLLGKNNCSTTIDKSDPAYLMQETVQDETAKFMMLKDVVSLLPATIVTVLMGPYSDRHGRKIPMMLSLMGSVLKVSIVLTVITYELNKYCLLIGTLIEGFCGGVPTMMMALFTYITDVTTHAQRSRRIFLLDMTLHMGAFAGGLIFCFLPSKTNYLDTMLFVQAVYFLAFLIVVLYLRETINTDRDESIADESRLLKMVQLYLRDDAHNRRWKLRLVLLILFLVSMVDLGGSEPVGLNLVGSPLCFTPLLIGLFDLTAFLAKFVLGTSVLKVLLSRLRETGLMMVGFLSGSVSYLIMAFATTKLIAFLVPVTGGLGVLTIPMARSVASKLVQPHEQGALFGSIAITQNVAAIVGTCLLNGIYTQSLYFMSGFVFLVYVLLLLTTLVCTIILHRGMRRHQSLRELGMAA